MPRDGRGAYGGEPREQARDAAEIVGSVVELPEVEGIVVATPTSTQAEVVEEAGWGNLHDDVDATWVLTPHDLSIGLEILGRLPKARAAAGDMTNGGRALVVGRIAELRSLAAS